MGINNTFICNCCGKEINAWPAITFPEPVAYRVLPDEAKRTIATIDDDFCLIKHQDHTDRFIRCTLFQTVNDSCQDLDYGIWVSLSEKSFEDYKANFNNEHHKTQYFGWLCSDIPDYDFSVHIPTTVITKPGNSRPEVVPHDDFDHPFVHDYYNGIPEAEAQRRVDEVIKDSRSTSKKTWWKFWQEFIGQIPAASRSC